jgi:molybdopterin molybdotransferase
MEVKLEIKDSELLDVQQALRWLLSRFAPLGMEEVPLRRAAGRVLFEDIHATIDLPSFPNSAMDGFAVRSIDVLKASQDNPIQLDVVVDIPAGQVVDISIGAGQAARIMTGAPVLEGADAVVPVENTDFNYRQPGLEAPESVKIFAPEESGANIRRRGDDVRMGETVMRSGRRLRSQDLGFLSMLGIGHVPVHRKPRVAIISSGSELLPVDAPLEVGKIYDANSYALISLVEQLGGEAIELGIVPDHLEAVQSSLERAITAEADLILSSAGVSVGAFDFIREVVEKEGRLDFWRVNMRPGKPLAFGEYRGTPFIGLPGNPVSAFIGFQVFVRPAIDKILGLDAGNRMTQRVVLLDPVSSDGREAFLRVIVSLRGDEMVARLTGHQGSGNMHSLVQANALLLVPSGVKSMPAGNYAEVWFIDDGLLGITRS